MDKTKRNKRQNQHIKKNYKRINAILPNSLYFKVLENYKDDENFSINSYVNRLIAMDIYDLENGL